MAAITVEQLRARAEGLRSARERNLAALRTLQEQETAYKYVLGELEDMIGALEAEAAAEAKAEPPPAPRSADEVGL